MSTSQHATISPRSLPELYLFDLGVAKPASDESLDVVDIALLNALPITIGPKQTSMFEGLDY
jgi:hypothetical protein